MPVSRFSPLLRWIALIPVVFRIAAEPSSPAEFDAAFSEIRTQAGTLPESVRLRALFDLWWRYQMVSNPELATHVGYPGLNDRWAAVSLAEIEQRRNEVQRSIQTLSTFDRRLLDPTNQLYFDLFQWTLRLQSDAGRHPSELMAITQLSGPQQGLASTVGKMPTASRQDVEAILTRLRTVGPRVAGVRELLAEGLKRGITAPRVTLRDVPRQVLENIPEDPRQSPFYRPFERLPSAWTEEERAACQQRATAAITNAVYPSFRALHRFLMDEYLPGARETLAATQLPGGEAWYAFLVREHTTTPLTPRQIHELGLSEVRRIRGQMEQVISQTGFRGTFAEFLAFTRTDPRFFYDRGTELLAGYRAIGRRIDEQLPRLFGRLPRLPYGVQPIPSFMERAQTTAYYQPGAVAMDRPGVFFANTYALNMRPKWEMEALTLHEAVPGHHLQLTLAQEIQGVPDFQRHAQVGAFVEGWALYAEGLGGDLGLYTDPYSRFGQLTYEMWRAIRLVLDTGIHAFGWSRQQAIDFFLENSGKTPHDIEVEVDRYIVWPGQALGYKIGELKIRELRAYAERQLGAQFDLRAFHDELLGQGAIPLDLLEPRMKAWVDRRTR